MASTLGAFAYRRRLTIDTTSGGANIAGTLSSFPVCVAVTGTSWGAAGSAHLFDASNTSGKRVQFFDSSGTNLSYEVETYDATGGTAIYWVNVPTLTGNSTTTIDVGYGSDPNGSDQSQGTATWDSNFIAVYHGYGFGDSSANNNAFTATNTLVTATGSVGLGYGTSRTSYYRGYRTSGSGWSANTNATLSCWLSSTDIQASKSYGGMGAITAGGGGLNIWQASATQIAGDIGGGGKYFSTNISSTPSHRAVVVTGGQARGAMICYTNGVDATGADFGSSYTSAIGASTSIAIGISPGSNTPVEGYCPTSVVDEMRLSKVVRSADWIKAEYWSMNATSWNGDGWLTVGAEQTAPRRIYAIRQAVNRSTVI